MVRTILRFWHNQRRRSTARGRLSATPAFCAELSQVETILRSGDIPHSLFLLEPKRLRMHGAFRYHGGWHPFVAALESGPGVLTAFYNAFQPKDLAEMYSLEKCGYRGEDAPQWTLPWMPLDASYAPTEEKGLSLEHGVSYYGPASQEKVELEYSRLATTFESIRDHGYQAEIDGGITGWFLEYKRDFVFFVRGGKHRAAVLSYNDPSQPIPVRVRDPALPIVRLDDCLGWPMVESGLISKELASAVFKRYFEVGGQTLALPQSECVPLTN